MKEILTPKEVIEKRIAESTSITDMLETGKSLEEIKNQGLYDIKLENKTYKMELTISNKGQLFRAETMGENMYENIDLILPKIEKQIIKQSSKKRDMFKKSAFDEAGYLFLEEKPEVKEKDVFKRKSFELVPETVEDAKYQLDNLEHDFYVFLNAETGKVNVIYKRRDDKLGLIECKY